MIKISTKELLENFNITNEKCEYKNNIPCVIDFNATWCTPCKSIHKTLTEMEKENSNIIFYSVDIEEEYELAEIFQIKNLPTLIMCSKENEPIKITGNIMKQKIQENINKMSIIIA